MDNNTTLKITMTGHRNLGRCYNATVWIIEACKPISWEGIQSIRAAGLLGYGQEFFGVAIAIDGSRRPTWEARYEAGRQVYLYEVEDRVDSSD